MWQIRCSKEPTLQIGDQVRRRWRRRTGTVRIVRDLVAVDFRRGPNASWRLKWYAPAELRIVERDELPALSAR